MEGMEQEDQEYWEGQAQIHRVNTQIYRVVSSQPADFFSPQTPSVWAGDIFSPTSKEGKGSH